MAYRSGSSWMDSGTQSAVNQTQPGSFADAESRAIGEVDRAFLYLKRVALGITIAAILASCMGVFWGIKRVSRIEVARQSLELLDAEYRWEHQPVIARHPRFDTPRQRLAKWIGNSTVSGLAAVNIDQPEANDAKLGFLSTLLETQSLQLYSDSATDRTLSIIANMPNLRYLKVLGSRFTIRGLLQLRNLPALEQLTIDSLQLSPVEFAVLKAELPGVDLIATKTPPNTNYSQTRMPRLVL